MYERAAAAAAVVLTAGLLVAGCSSGASYDDKVSACEKAIKAGDADGASTPAPCQKISADDYGTLRVRHLVDNNGQVDLSKLFDTPAP